MPTAFYPANLSFRPCELPESNGGPTGYLQGILRSWIEEMYALSSGKGAVCIQSKKRQRWRFSAESKMQKVLG